MHRIYKDIKEEREFLGALRHICFEGFELLDRTGVGTWNQIGLNFKYDLSDNKIPLWTTRKIPWRNQLVELLFFLRGRTDVKWLQDRNVKIWNSWVKPNGEIGAPYSLSWRNFGCTFRMYEEHVQNQNRMLNNWIKGEANNDGTDQFSRLIEGIRKDPTGRRHIVTLWNPMNVSEQILPACHGNLIQFVVDNNKGLHCLQHQRSADMILGYCPWQYAMLTHIVAALTGTTPKSLTCTIGSAHIYKNQEEGLMTLLERDEKFYKNPDFKGFPTFKILKQLNTVEDVESCEETDFELVGYEPMPFIKFPVAV